MRALSCDRRHRLAVIGSVVIFAFRRFAHRY